jgi:serine/threonine protein phosphatase PrpC
VRFQVGHKTDVGRVRQGNEDSYLVDHTMNLFAVADGMGGHRAGEVASHTALAELRSTMETDGQIHVAEAVAAANDAVYQKAVDDPSLQGMGTTLTAVKMEGTTALFGHVGDSRAYLLRDGAMTRVTADHSFVEQLRREGRITAEQAAVHPQRSILTRALGIEPGVAIDREERDLVHGDRLMLCSDGLHALVSEPVIEQILMSVADPMAAADALIVAANEAGGDDNITALVIDVFADGEGPEPVAAASHAVSHLDGATAPGATVDLSAPEVAAIAAVVNGAAAANDLDATLEIPEVEVLPDVADLEPAGASGLGAPAGSGADGGPTLQDGAPGYPLGPPLYDDPALGWDGAPEPGSPAAAASAAASTPTSADGSRARSPWVWMVPAIVVLGVALGLLIWYLAR